MSEKMYLYVAVGPMCWGKGVTEEAAIEACRENYSRGKPRCRVWKANTLECFVDGMGGVTAEPMHEGHDVELTEIGERQLALPHPKNDDDPNAKKLKALGKLIEHIDGFDVTWMIKSISEFMDEPGELEEAFANAAIDVEEIEIAAQSARQALGE